MLIEDSAAMIEYLREKQRLLYFIIVITKLGDPKGDITIRSRKSVLRQYLNSKSGFSASEIRVPIDQSRIVLQMKKQGDDFTEN